MKRSVRTMMSVASAVLIASAAAACGSGSDTGPGDGLTTFRSVSFPGETYALDQIASEKGFFKDHGLDVSYLSPQSGSAAVQMLAAGEVDGWSTAPSIIYNAHSQGQSVGLAGLVNSFTAYEIIVASDADWTKPDGTFEEKMTSLEGKTIGVSGLAAGTDLALLSALDVVGLGENDVKRLGVGTTLSGLGQLSSGKIDAYVEFTGSGARLIADDGAGERYVGLYGDDVPEQVDVLSDLGLAINSDWAEENPDSLDAWREALGEARQWLEDPANVDEAATIVADASYEGENLEEVKEALSVLGDNLAATESGFEADPERVNLQIEVLQEIGGLPAGADLDATEVIVD